MNHTIQTRWIAFSECIYRALLMLYPANYRREYGRLMLQIFRDVSRGRYHRQGMIGVVLWWGKTLLDLIVTVIEQRRKAGIQMSVLSQFLRRFSGVLLIAGGLLLCFGSLAELQPGWNYPLRDIYQIFGFALVPAMVLISLGTIGLLLKYQVKVGSVGKLALFGAACGVLVITANFIIVLITNAENLWNMFLGGLLLHAASLIVFGLTAIGVRPLPRWNWLPIVIGAMPFILLLFNPNRNGFDTEWENIAAYVVMGIGFAALGYVMHKDQVRETAAVPA